MSEPDLAAPSNPLLARKGDAAPAAALTRGRAAETERPDTEPTPPKSATKPETSTEEPAPPGSLLSFGLRRRGEARDVLAAAPSDAPVAPPAPVRLVAEAAAAIGVVHPPRTPHRAAAIAAVVLIALVAVGGAWYGYDRVAGEIEADPQSVTPAAGETHTGAEATAPPAIAGEAPAAEAPPAAAEEPSFDVVRVSPSGDAVIAGRAAPHTELIVLDNGEPIGTVRADAIGDWILIPATPLDSGEHEFSLVVKTPRGTIVLPPPAAATVPGDTAAPPPQSNAAPPPPAPKPATASAPAATSAFLVQLASVKSATGATQEWSRLQRDFPDLLSDKKLRVDRANLGERGAFFRIRTGPFDDREQAHGLCQELTAREQSCLVIER